MNRRRIYVLAKTAVLLAIIPIVLVSGPIVGYLISDLLIKKCNLPNQTTAICVILGFIASLVETVKIINIALKVKE